MSPEIPIEVAAAFAEFPAGVAARLVDVRDLVFSVAAELPATGGVRESLAWGQPSYRPERDGIGTSVRLGAHTTGRPALFVHCGTSLISEFRAVIGHLEFEGRRGLLLPVEGPLPERELRVAIELAFTAKRRRRQ